MPGNPFDPLALNPTPPSPPDVRNLIGMNPADIHRTMRGEAGSIPDTGLYGTPSWWKPYSYTGAYDPNAELAMTVNSLLPSMSPIDRRYWTSWLYQQDPAKFAGYNPASNLDFGTEGTEAQRGAFVSANRANQAWSNLQRDVLGLGDTDTTNDKKIEDMGAAIPWLQRVMNTASRYAPSGTGTGGDRRTRAQELALQNDLVGLWGEAQASPDLQPYLEVAKRFIAPSYKTAPISTPVPVGARESAYPANYYSYSRNNYVSNPRFL